ncbi:MAG: hypothetical protein AB7N65_31635, partial [Vicinamibacterales bacterium]
MRTRAHALGFQFLSEVKHSVILHVGRDESSGPSCGGLLVFFAAAAVIARVFFWAYTGRVWDDSLIALTSARNFWDGFGLTHHASEPRVYSFTSAIGELILVAGEGFGQGLLITKLVSILAAVATIYSAYRIGIVLSFGWASHVLVLTYLSLDHLQIFFGMAGMETQVATALILASVYCYLVSRWTPLGITLGLAVLVRPEFWLWAVILGVVLLVSNRGAFYRVAALAAAVALPWFVFAELYFGSIIPHTVAAKSAVFARRPFAPIAAIRQACFDWWANIAPFRQYWAAPEAPVHDIVLKIVVLVLVTLAGVGVYRAWRARHSLIAVAVFVAGFALYRTLSVTGNYHMWYLTPFMALLFIIAGFGLSMPRLGRIRAPVAVTLACCYAGHLPFTLPLDRLVQEEIEVGMLTRVGRTLNSIMGPTDTAVLEPMGRIGWEARNKTIYDYPGLTSRVSLDALAPGAAISDLIVALSPTFAVLRPGELDDLARRFPHVSRQYTPLVRITPERP